MKIDKNILIPTGRGKFRDIVNKMEDGDSVYVENQNDRAALRNLITRSGFSAVSRTEGDGWRVWKISK